ncbi:MAG: MarR family transcriptional regulator [Bryobacteraceae bacterium]
MTDITLTPIQSRFVLHWGEMGTRWGVNRTVAQAHALLYIWPTPLHAEQIAAVLSVARSNISNSLRELQGWGLVRVVHVLGDRRDHFEAGKDVWKMFEIVLAERKRREIDPTVAMLREVSEDSTADDYTRERLDQMLNFLETMSACYADFERMPGGLAAFAKLRGKLKALFSLPKRDKKS